MLLYGAFKIIFSPETFSTSLGHTGDNLERRFRRHLGGRGLISSLINIISLLLTSFNSAVTLKLKCGKVVCVEFFIFGGSLLGRIQGDREPVSLLE